MEYQSYKQINIYKEGNDREINHTDIYVNGILSFTFRIYANLIQSKHGIYSMFKISVTLLNLIQHFFNL